MRERIQALLDESLRIKQQVAATMIDQIAQAAGLLTETLRAGGMVVFCGNGGSAADCQHLAGELVSRFRRERPAWRALALTTDTSVLTAIGNDYSYADVFTRQVQAWLGPGDLLVALSTSGNSENCLRAVREARARGARSLGLSGAGGGQLREAVDLCLCVPSVETARIQEAHITIGHIICELVEAALTESPS